MRLYSEDHILALIDAHFPRMHDALIVGRGDDCAVMRPSGALCVSSDVFMEHVHFRQRYFTPAEVGHKALAVNISDIAAMGATPVVFNLCLGLPPALDVAWLDACLDGMARLARQHDMALAGGDISRSESIHISITLWGTPGQDGIFLTRAGSRVGDSIFCVGGLGLARVGLLALEAYGRETACQRWPVACTAHLMPIPQVLAGQRCARIAAKGRMTLMDVSDGLARDMPRLLAGGTCPLGAEIALPDERLPAEVQTYALAHGHDPCMLAVQGGEDYALLGTCAPEILPLLQKALPSLYPVGVVTDSGKLLCQGHELHTQGFDHFA